MQRSVYENYHSIFCISGKVDKITRQVQSGNEHYILPTLICARLVVQNRDRSSVKRFTENISSLLEYKTDTVPRSICKARKAAPVYYVFCHPYILSLFISTIKDNESCVSTPCYLCTRTEHHLRGHHIIPFMSTIT